MTKKETLEHIKVLEEAINKAKHNKILRFYPEQGRLSRINYPKHMAFFDAGREYFERCMLAANRVGKTEGVGCCEMTYHLTGKYPVWWTGKRFTCPINAWAATTSNEKTRDILQRKYSGPITEMGTGMIPADDIVAYSRKSGIPDAIETITVKHYTNGYQDGNSTLYFKSYAQGREAFQGEEIHVIHLDEEPPMDIYTECLTRTMKTEWFDGGIIMCTFTPLEGISEVTEMFMPGANVPDSNVVADRFVINVTWDDAPHLDEAEKARLLRGIPEYQRDARTKGIPILGSGAIYPIAEEDILIEDFPIPKHWPQAYGFDVGWDCTAALWGAWDMDKGEKGTLYVHSVYKRGHAEPIIHATNIKSRGDWINGVSDPAARQSNQNDGTKLFEEYRKLGLNLYVADNAVEAGLFDVYQGFVAGEIKIFKSCMDLIEEKRLYRRDKNGKVIKAKDHLMDCLRYLKRSGRQRAKTGTENNTIELFRQRQIQGSSFESPLHVLNTQRDEVRYESPIRYNQG
jgi:phage terminase large subunit-like protein